MSGAATIYGLQVKGMLDDVDMQIIYGNNSHSLNGLFFFPSF